VNRVVPLDQLDAEVRNLANSIIAKSPLAISMGKRMFYRQIEMGVEDAYELAAETMACNMMAQDAGEGSTPSCRSVRRSGRDDERRNRNRLRRSRSRRRSSGASSASAGARIMTRTSRASPCRRC